jgi:hypothetical protein
MENVFATAVGFYRIRESDPDHDRYVPAREAARDRGRLKARTLENSVVKPWSWPCVLVFVREWMEGATAGARCEQLVPPFLYLEDGTTVPVCVVQASSFPGAADRFNPVVFGARPIGGGYPVMTEVQGREHVASVGCVVTDGDRYYALTNQHVTGAEGREVYTVTGGKRQRVGKAARSIGRKPFGEVYPGLAGRSTQANLDVGLVDVEDASDWTAQVFGLGVLGELVHFDSTASLDWVGCKVVAHGAVSGRLEGEIKALFYRYRTIAGMDYVSDFLVGGRGHDPLPTAPGDSGTLWCIDPAELRNDQPGRAKPAREIYRPFAIQWGGQKLSNSGRGGYTQYALASSLAVACRELDVELVTDLNAEHPQYWGPVGHYKTAAIAADQCAPTLKRFLAENLEQLTYGPAQIADLAKKKLKPTAAEFVPLADVADVVWKSNINRTRVGVRAQENWNHYADMDLPGADGRTLFEVCGDPARLDLAEWIEFYRNAPDPAGSGRHVNMGGLPFRIWQVFDALADYRRRGKKAEFLCAAGILAHYVGDACQPLHSSMHSDGLNGAATGVHGAYEEKMVDQNAAELQQMLDEFDAARLGPKLKEVSSGYEAGLAAIDLMRRIHKTLPPADICHLYESLGGRPTLAVTAAMWQKLRLKTVTCLADGARTLAMLWNSAYRVARDGEFSGKVSRPRLESLYMRESFLPSLHLANLDPDDYKVPERAAAVAAAKR